MNPTYAHPTTEAEGCAEISVLRASRTIMGQILNKVHQPDGPLPLTFPQHGPSMDIVAGAFILSKESISPAVVSNILSGTPIPREFFQLICDSVTVFANSNGPNRQLFSPSEFRVNANDCNPKFDLFNVAIESFVDESTQVNVKISWSVYIASFKMLQALERITTVHHWTGSRKYGLVGRRKKHSQSHTHINSRGYSAQEITEIKDKLYDAATAAATAAAEAAYTGMPEDADIADALIETADPLHYVHEGGEIRYQNEFSCPSTMPLKMFLLEAAGKVVGLTDQPGPHNR